MTITAADIRTSVALALDTLEKGAELDWEQPAGTLSWTVRETVDHMADDLFAYAGQLSPEREPLSAYVPFLWTRRPDGPALTVRADPKDGAAGLLQVLDASGGLLAALVEIRPPQRRAYHPMGVSDPEGFAAMGIVEVLAHTHDVATGLRLPWTPPEDLCDRVLRRLFPHAPAGTDRWATLLWATGRGDLPGHARLTSWRWHGEPRVQNR
ncbi:maleylpyruvate isomerase N-terminal domain-containing protein [Actinoplanes sp. NPDC051861]|uniref:maleylpyruvate isomerase N-terminal domain-containing protein n=1 Tax=Actinoplanes sp. NPDC051861 TaxID=3155170 RepID=UPI00342AFF51